MRHFVILLALAALCVGAAYAAPEPVARIADRLLTFQTPDGAITMSASTRDRVVPYFGNMGGIGLVAAYRSTRDARYLDAARRWALWYEARMQPDGTIDDFTGGPGAWKATGKRDSTDSYAATWLEMVDAIVEARPDAAWLAKRYPAAQKAVAAIRLTMQPNGLTLAKPDWPVMYTMDNVEVWRGLAAAARLARRSGDAASAAEWQALADRCGASVNRDLWDASRECFYIGIQPDGGRMEGLKEWYPDVMANLMAVGWGPPSSRKAPLYALLRSRFPNSAPTVLKTEDDLEHAVWWGYAAEAAKDAALLATLRARIAGYAGPVTNPATLGHALRLTATAKPQPDRRSPLDESPLAKLQQRLVNLLACVHHEGPVAGGRLSQGLARE